MIADIKTIEDNIYDMTGKSYMVARHSFLNLINDLSIIVHRNKDKYAEEIMAIGLNSKLKNSICYKQSSWAGKIHMEGYQEGYLEGYLKGYLKGLMDEKINTVLTMLKRNYESQEIHFITQVPIETIEELRNKNM